MAAKKSRASKKTAKKGSSTASDSVIVSLDTDTVLTLHAAIEALSELASALILASDDPALRGKSKAAPKRKATAKKSR